MKKKTYVLTVSKVFPSDHPRAGQETDFVNKILRGEKIHTIRANYDLWKKRIDNVSAGEAVLSLRQWEGKPYNSKQIEFLQLDKAGIQPVYFEDYFYSCCVIKSFRTLRISCDDICKNDGLESEDFERWFRKYDLSKPMAIIHFTEFRY